MIVVSHDRYFLDRIIDKLLVIGTDEFGQRCLGRMEFINIKPVYSYYASLVRKREQIRQQKLAPRNIKGRKRRPAGAKEKLRPKTPEEIKRFNKYSVKQIEDMITALEQELAGMRERFGDAIIYKNPEQFAELKQSYEDKTTELDLLYQAYEHRTG